MPQAPDTTADLPGDAGLISGVPAPRIEADLEIDVTREVCPMTYVRTRLALDRLQVRQVLAVTLSGAEPARNVPDTARTQGHEVLEEMSLPGGSARILIRKRK